MEVVRPNHCLSNGDKGLLLGGMGLGHVGFTDQNKSNSRVDLSGCVITQLPFYLPVIVSRYL